MQKLLCVKVFVCTGFCVQKLVCKSCCVCVGLCVCLCVYMCKHVSLRVSVFESLSAYLYVCIFHIFNNLLYSIPCLYLATKTLTSSHLLILTSKHNEHIHMISSNIIINIFMQVFGACKSYNYITHLSTYTPTRSRANHRLVIYIYIYIYYCLISNVVNIIKLSIR